jgi:hypothetical protein
VIDHYRVQEPDSCIEINGEQSVEEIFKDIVSKIELKAHEL